MNRKSYKTPLKRPLEKNVIFSKELLGYHKTQYLTTPLKINFGATRGLEPPENQMENHSWYQ